MSEALSKNTIGEFIDAAVRDQPLAERMLRAHPELRDARWHLGETALHFLAVEYATDAVRFLCERGFDARATNEFGDAALIDVATLGNVEIAEILLHHGADANCLSNARDHVIFCAIDSGKPRLVELLLLHGANPNAESIIFGRPLHTAVCAGSVEMVGALLAAGARTDYSTARGETVADALPPRGEKRAALRAVFRKFGVIVA